MQKKIINFINREFLVDLYFGNELINDHPKFKRFINLAHETSMKATFERNKIGAIIVYKGKILSKGFNELKTHTIQKKYNNLRPVFSEDAEHFIHAEVNAIKKAKSLGADLNGAEIYIYHLGHTKVQKMARPCEGCMRAIIDSGIKKIHYSTPDGFATEFLSKSKTKTMW